MLVLFLVFYQKPEIINSHTAKQWFIFPKAYQKNIVGVNTQKKFFFFIKMFKWLQSSATNYYINRWSIIYVRYKLKGQGNEIEKLVQKRTKF